MLWTVISFVIEDNLCVVSCWTLTVLETGGGGGSSLWSTTSHFLFIHTPNSFPTLTHTHTNTNMCTNTQTHAHTCMRTQACAHTHTHTHTQTQIHTVTSTWSGSHISSIQDKMAAATQSTDKNKNLKCTFKSFLVYLHKLLSSKVLTSLPY